MTTSTTATITYCSGSGCALTSPGSNPGACRNADSGISSSSRSRSVSSRVATVPSDVPSDVPSVLNVLASSPCASIRHQVHDGEDHDPHHVDEVPVQAGDLDALGVALA